MCKLATKYNGEIFLVTKQSKKSRIETLKWLAKHKIHVNVLYFMKYGESKTEAACDILIDDNISNLNEQEAKGGNAICIKRPWKKIRYSNYLLVISEVESLFKKLSKPNNIKKEKGKKWKYLKNLKKLKKN